MRFDPERYTASHIMICDTREQSDRFREFMHKNGFKWAAGQSYEQLDYFDQCLSGIGYAFIEGTYESKHYFTSTSYHILNFEDFDWEDYEEHLDISDEDASKIDLYFSQFNRANN